MLYAMNKTFTLGCRMLFLVEKRTEPYRWYGDGSIADENDIMRQEFLGKLSSAWLKGEMS
jgi:hypothetical protein